ncbi:PucR family transcriptional regulator [Streptosporangium sp. NPDC004631]
MELTLQDIAENLAGVLQRSVAIDDPNLNLLAYSPHYGPVDGARLSSILHRRAPEREVAYILGLGIRSARSPMRVPASTDLKMMARLCVPIRQRRLHLGYLWLIDADESLSREQISQAAAAAEEAGAILYRNSLVQQVERSRERELIRDLLNHRPDLRRDAAAKLIDQELFPSTGTVVCLVVRALGAQSTGERTQLALDTALAEARRQIPIRRALHLAKPDHGILIVTPGDPAGARTIDDLGEVLRKAMSRGMGDIEQPARVIVGVGEPQAGLVDANASYEQALQAVHVAEVVPTTGDVARWDRLGVYRIIALLPTDKLTRNVLEPGVNRLLASDKDGTLTHTLEAFLDHAGNVKETSEILNLHRTSLYYRLSRAEEITGLTLSDGNNRLALHLGLKVARLAGIHPEAPSR